MDRCNCQRTTFTFLLHSIAATNIWTLFFFQPSETALQHSLDQSGGLIKWCYYPQRQVSSKAKTTLNNYFYLDDNKSSDQYFYLLDAEYFLSHTRSRLICLFWLAAVRPVKVFGPLEWTEVNCFAKLLLVITGFYSHSLFNDGDSDHVCIDNCWLINLWGKVDVQLQNKMSKY